MDAALPGLYVSAVIDVTVSGSDVEVIVKRRWSTVLEGSLEMMQPRLSHFIIRSAAAQVLRGSASSAQLWGDDVKAETFLVLWPITAARRSYPVTFPGLATIALYTLEATVWQQHRLHQPVR